MEGLNMELAKVTDIPLMLELWKDTSGVGLGVGDDEEIGRASCRERV